MPFISPELNNPNTLKYFGTYKPYRVRDEWGEYIVNPNFDIFSGKVLDLKEGKEGAVEYFWRLINPTIKNDIAFVTVPSHDPQNLQSGVKKLASKLATQGNRIDATSCLVRHTKIAKLANGGARDRGVHLNSIPFRMKYRKIIISMDKQPKFIQTKSLKLPSRSGYR